MPVFNRPVYIEKAIESVLAQSFQDFELIIIDDGSTDPVCRQLLISYAARYPDRIRLFRNQQNIGPAASRNRAIMKVRGEYIALMDSDDISLPGRLERQYNYLQNNSYIAACSLHHQQIDADGTPINIIDGFGRQKGSARPTTQYEVQRSALYFGPNSATPSMMVRAHIMRKMKGYRLWFEAGSDMDLSLRLEEHYPVALLKEADYLYRRYSGNLVHLKGVYQFYGITARISAVCRRKKLPDPITRHSNIWQVLQQLHRLPHYAVQEFRQKAQNFCQMLAEAHEYEKADFYWQQFNESLTEAAERAAYQKKSKWRSFRKWLKPYLIKGSG